MAITQIMLMSLLKQTPGVCHHLHLLEEHPGVMEVILVTMVITLIILKCHHIQMGHYKNQDLQLETIPEVIIVQLVQQLAIVFLGIPMGLDMGDQPHPHPLQDMVPMTEEDIMEDDRQQRISHQIITSCHPRESTVEKLSEFSLITTTNNKKFHTPTLSFSI